MTIMHVVCLMPEMVYKLKLAYSDMLENAACIGRSYFSYQYPPAAEFIFSLRDFGFLHQSPVVALVLQHGGVLT